MITDLSKICLGPRQGSACFKSSSFFLHKLHWHFLFSCSGSKRLKIHSLDRHLKKQAIPNLASLFVANNKKLSVIILKPGMTTKSRKMCHRSRRIEIFVHPLLH